MQFNTAHLASTARFTFARLNAVHVFVYVPKRRQIICFVYVGVALDNLSLINVEEEEVECMLARDICVPGWQGFNNWSAHQLTVGDWILVSRGSKSGPSH